MMVFYTRCLILLTFYVFGPLPASFLMDYLPQTEQLRLFVESVIADCVLHVESVTDHKFRVEG